MSWFRAPLCADVGFCVFGVAVLVGGSAWADVTISSAATQNMNCSHGTCAPTASKAMLNSGDLQNLLAAGSVTITTTGSGVQATNITVSAPVSWSAQNNLSFDAWKSITVSQTISATGTGGLSLDTDDGGNGGALFFGVKGSVTFKSLSSSLTINGTAYTLVNSLASLASAVASNQDGNFALAGNYDAGGDGTYSQSPVEAIYDGHFEGLGNAISNLSIDDGNAGDNAGLFYELYPDGSVSDLYVSNVNINSANVGSAGAITGDNQGIIANSRSSGIVNGGQFGSGGISGYSSGYIMNSSSTASVTGAEAGGLIGQNTGIISNSRATGNVEAVTGPNSPIGGGLVGDNQGTVETSWATGSVKSNTDGSSVGGLIGEMDSGSLDNSYATGASSAAGTSFVGGMVGYTGVGLANAYSTGAPSGTGRFVGGFVGYDDSTGMKHAYWDTTTSGVTDLSKGAGNIANDPGIKGLSTSKLQAKLPKGFSAKIWTENAQINGGLPYLRDNPPTK